jgi:oligogalacturonide lyase
MTLADPAAWSRRSFLIALPAGCLAQNAKPRIFPSTLTRYLDPLTEFPVLRLTNPSYASRLPGHYARAVSRRSTFLLYASDLTGRWEAFQMDLRSGQSRQLTEAENLEPASLTLLANDRGFCYFDGKKLLTVTLANMRIREVYRVPEGFEPGRGLSVTEDGQYAALVENTAGENGSSRLRLVRMANGSARDLAVCSAEHGEELRDPIPRPHGTSVLYRCGSAIWMVDYDGQHQRQLPLAEGETGPAMWSPDGRTVLYLNYPADPQKLHNLREFSPDSDTDRMIANTTQFVEFASNADASVFVGASGGKASPQVLLLVRAVRRELTLAEHRASNPGMVSPIFTPNSQRIFFMSDRDGKPAIYTMSVTRLVEKTEDEGETGAGAPNR